MAQKQISEETKALVEQLKEISPDDACTQSCWDTFHFEEALCKDGDEYCRNKALDRLRACVLECGSKLEGGDKNNYTSIAEKLLASLA